VSETALAPIDQAAGRTVTTVIGPPRAQPVTPPVFRGDRGATATAIPDELLSAKSRDLDAIRAALAESDD
jgi:hypothetical protein